MNSTAEAQEALRAALAPFPIVYPPPRLLRFGPPETLALLRRGLVPLTPPKYFNDPFEAWAGISVDNISAEEVVRSLCSESGIFYLALKASNPAAISDRLSMVKRLQEIARARPDLWPEHLATCVNSVRSTISEQIGVSCFSGFSEDDLLGPVGIRHWAMYGGEHRGFAVEYDGEHSFFRRWAETKWMFPVEYCAKRLLVPLNEFDEWNDTKMWRTFRQWTAIKSVDAWGAEREWRIMCPVAKDGSIPHVVCEGKNDAQRFFLRLWDIAEERVSQGDATRIVRRIILGVRADHLLSQVLEVRNELHLSHVEIWRTKPCVRDYRLVLEQVY